MKQSQPLISLKNVGIQYKRRSKFKKKAFWALKNINLDIYKGETLGIIGHNGAGKSTLLKVIANLMTPDEGEYIRNTNMRAGILALKAGFISSLSGRDNILLSGLFLGVSAQYIKSKTQEIIALSGIEEFIDSPVKSYSTGMSARLGFAIAYHCAPDILLLDEVLGVGDAQFKKLSKKLILEMVHSKKTVILVSHNEETVKDICTRVIRLEKGCNSTIK
jgi:lipopolysaccharide transport system ATP-binding protein